MKDTHNLIIKNGNVFDATYKFHKGSITIDNDVIRGVCFDEEKGSSLANTIINAENLYVLPGLTDIHLHGCRGNDFCDGSEAAFDNILSYELSNGITSVCLTTMSFSEERLQDIFEAFCAYKNETGSKILGINMEGPFLSNSKKGAQNEDYLIKPDIAMYDRLQERSGGKIVLLDLAPELDGALEFIEATSSNVNISLAHTDADYETANKAFLKGANHVTHLYNAMNGFEHRKPGVVGAVADNENVYAEIIGDGIHVAAPVVRATLKLLGDDRVVLISDSMEACGMPDGDYELGGQEVKKLGNKATLSDGTIAGAVSNLFDNLIYLVKEMNISLETAIKCAAVNPIKSIGMYDTYGSIEKDKKANLILLDKDLNLKYVIKDGKIEYSY